MSDYKGYCTYREGGSICECVLEQAVEIERLRRLIGQSGAGEMSDDAYERGYRSGFDCAAQGLQAEIDRLKAEYAILFKDHEQLLGDMAAIKSTMRFDEERIRNMETRMREMHDEMVQVVSRRDEAMAAARWYHEFADGLTEKSRFVARQCWPWLEGER